VAAALLGLCSLPSPALGGSCLEDVPSGSVSAVARVGAPCLDDRRPGDFRSEFDDVVVLGRAGDFFCTGTLIHPRVVLTARHCLPLDEVRFGPSADRAIGARGVARVVEHPDPAFDIALVVLDREVDTVRPRSLRPAWMSEVPPMGMVRAIGYGADGRSIGAKRALGLAATGWGCDPQRRSRYGCTPEHELLVPGFGGLDTCRGDSGGPLMERDGSGWRLLGVTSRSIAGADRDCGDGGIYTRVDRLEGWIAAELGSMGSGANPGSARRGSEAHGRRGER
jgi:hypothetical protein